MQKGAYILRYVAVTDSHVHALSVHREEFTSKLAVCGDDGRKGLAVAGVVAVVIGTIAKAPWGGVAEDGIEHVTELQGQVEEAEGQAEATVHLGHS
jgi:hypothetical protein